MPLTLNAQLEFVKQDDLIAASGSCVYRVLKTRLEKLELHPHTFFFEGALKSLPNGMLGFP